MNPKVEKKPFEKILQGISGLQEPFQRAYKTFRWLQEQPPFEVAEFLEQLFSRTYPSSNLAHVLQLDLLQHRHQIDQWPYDRLQEIFHKAKQKHWKSAMAFLRSSISHPQRESIPKGFSQQLKTLTLGEKKQWSRHWSRKKFECLLFDSNPAVIRELLKNPRVTELDVLRIATRHQAPSIIIEELCRSPKWMVRYRIKKALVFNPQTPFALVSGLLGQLQKKDLKLFMNGGSSRKELLQMAKEKLQGSLSEPQPEEE